MMTYYEFEIDGKDTDAYTTKDHFRIRIDEWYSMWKLQRVKEIYNVTIIKIKRYVIKHTHSLRWDVITHRLT